MGHKRESRRNNEMMLVSMMGRGLVSRPAAVLQMHCWSVTLSEDQGLTRGLC